MKFIEVHGENGAVISINVNHIVGFADRQLIISNSTFIHPVRESYEELKALVQGVHLPPVPHHLREQE